MMKRAIILVAFILAVSSQGFMHVEADDLPTNTLAKETASSESCPIAESVLFPTNVANQREAAAPRATQSGPIANYPNLFIVNSSTGISNGRIPGEYANLLRLTNQSKYTIVGASTTTSNYARFTHTNTEAATNGKHYVEISNVAVYQGKDIDVRINIENMTGKSGIRNVQIQTPTRIGSSDFLELRFRGTDNELFLRYEFLDHKTGELVPYKGTWIVKRLNNFKTLQFDTTPEHLKSIFAYSTSALQYATVNNFESTVFSSTSGSTGANNVLNQLMFSMDAYDGKMRHRYFPRGAGVRYVYYDYVAIAPFDVSHPNIQGRQSEEYPRVKYRITQDYPAQNKTEYYPKRYKMTVKLDEILKMDQVKYTVKNLEGDDVTNKFIMTKNDSKSEVYFELSAQSLSDESFANNMYTIDLESDIDWTVPRDKYVKEDGYFHIPATVKMETDVNNSPTVQSIAKTKYIKGYVNIQYLLDDEKTELLTPEQIEGEIGDDYTVESKEIDKYKLIKTNGKLEGILEKETKLIQFIYEKIPNVAPVLTLDQQTNEELEYDGNDFKLSGQVSDENSEEITVYYTVDNGEAVNIAKFSQKEDENKLFDFESIIKSEILKDGKKHIVIVYAEDNEGLKSNEQTLSLAAFKGELKVLSIPKELIFGEEAVVSAKEKVYYVAVKIEDLIVEDTRLNSGGWQLSIRLTKPLTSESGHIIKDALRYNDEVMQLNEATKIFEQKELLEKPVNISKNWIDNQEGLNLMIPSGVAEAETYSTEMVWTVDNIPEN